MLKIFKRSGFLLFTFVLGRKYSAIDNADLKFEIFTEMLALRFSEFNKTILGNLSVYIYECFVVWKRYLKNHKSQRNILAGF